MVNGSLDFTGWKVIRDKAAGCRGKAAIAKGLFCSKDRTTAQAGFGKRVIKLVVMRDRLGTAAKVQAAGKKKDKKFRNVFTGHQSNYK